MARPKPFQIALAAVAAAAVAGLLWVKVIQPQMTETMADKMGRGDYALTATDGTLFTEDTLKGAPSAVFFVFSFVKLTVRVNMALSSVCILADFFCLTFSK